MEFAIEVNQLSKSYPGIKALNGVMFSVKKGEVCALLGPNGAGKTTTMNCLSGLIKPDSGSIKVSGKLGYLPENPPLYKDMVVESYLKFIGGIHDIKGDKLKRNLEFAFEKTGIEPLKRRLIQNLSKGQKQRVGLASILVQDCEILILDEPTVGLDPESIIEIRKLIMDLKQEKTILLSTHQLREVELCADSISIINKGEVVYSELTKKEEQNSLESIYLSSIGVVMTAKEGMAHGPENLSTFN